MRKSKSQQGPRWGVYDANLILYSQQIWLPDRISPVSNVRAAALGNVGNVGTLIVPCCTMRGALAACSIWRDAQVQEEQYRYYKPETRGLDQEGLLEDLSKGKKKRAFGNMA